MKHEFEVSSPGLYETAYKCKYCGVEIVDSIDPPKTSPLRDEECPKRNNSLTNQDIGGFMYQCPYDEACKCSMEDGCAGCETWKRTME
jgi:hypothetical protein